MFTGGAATSISTPLRLARAAFAVSLTVICGLPPGILPALRSTRVAPTDAIKAQSRQVGHAGGRRGAMVGKTLVATQMAFCLLLLVVAGLFIRSMQALARPTSASIAITCWWRAWMCAAWVCPDDQRQALYDRVLDRLRVIPGVVSVSASLNGPLGTSWRASSIVVEGYTPAANDRLVTNEEFVTPDYFATVGLAIVEGRGFSWTMLGRACRSTISTRHMASRFFPKRSGRQTLDLRRRDSARLAGDRRRRPGREIRRRARRDAEHALSVVLFRTGGGARQSRDSDRRRARVARQTVRQALAEIEPALLSSTSFRSISA